MDHFLRLYLSLESLSMAAAHSTIYYSRYSLVRQRTRDFRIRDLRCLGTTEETFRDTCLSLGHGQDAWKL